MDNIIKFGLFSLGIAAILIGGSIAIFGSNAVVTFFNGVLSLFYNDGEITDLASPNVDNELRFYGVMFAFYGLILVQTASDIKKYFARIPLLLTVFALAGLARLIGYLFVGKPQMLFIVLMAIEFTLPAILILCWYKRKKDTS